MPKTQYVLLFMVLFATTAFVHSAEQQDSAALVAVLESDAPKAEKAITCKRLAVFGNEDAVPALAPLLEDPELASWARIALEAIPGPEADAALREALGKLDGRLLVGAINSIAVRADAQAVQSLARRLNDSDAAVASAAAAALGRIGNAEATGVLAETLDGAPAEVRSAVAEGCILCAEKLLESGDAQAAAALYDRVRQAEVPGQRIVEATRGAILARKAEGVPLLIEQLKSDNKALVGIGLTTARELAGEGVTEALVASLDEVPGVQRSQLIHALADRGDPAALPAMLEATKSGHTLVRIAAIKVLRRLGDASCIPVLLEAATDTDPFVAQAARSALEELPGDSVDADLVERLATAEGSTREVLIQLVGQRRINAIPALLESLDDTETSIRCAALAALGETVDLDRVGVLIDRVVDPPHSVDTRAAVKALRAACVRMPDLDACAEELVAAMDQADTSEKRVLLEVLGAMGGGRALKAVGAAGKSGAPELQDTATQLLGKWMTADAATVLLDLAKSDIDTKYKVRALRGYLRIARQFDLPDSDRVAMCRTALKLAERVDEKKLVLEVLERYPSVETMRLAVEAAEDPALEDEARAAALAIAQNVGGAAGVRELLTQVGQKPVEVEIIKAEYGDESTFKDVTEIVRKHAGSLPLIVLPSSSYNASFGGDPLPGVRKQLKIRYRLDGKQGEASFDENATILLPAPGNK